MADTFQLEIVTPEKKVVDTKAEEVQIPGKNGYLGILPGHAPLITELAVGEIKIRESNGEQKLAVASDCLERKEHESRLGRLHRGSPWRPTRLTSTWPEAAFWSSCNSGTRRLGPSTRPSG